MGILNYCLNKLALVQELQPKLEPIHVVGIIMAHSSYKSEFIEAIIEDVLPFCLDQSCIKGIDDAILGVQSVEENYPKVIGLLCNDPTDKLRTIATFRNGMVHEHMLRDRSTLLPALQTILTNILIKTKTFTFANTNTGMDWKEALKVRFDEAVPEHGLMNHAIPKCGNGSKFVRGPC